jgi:hypothetical protein
MARRSKRCVFCREHGVTAQHVIHDDWKNKVPIPDSPSEFYYSKHGEAGTRPDAPLFGLQVKQVCGPCNRGWMVRLELDVEPWILNPDMLDAPFSPKTFRRWAIMTAIMRSYVDHSRWGVVPRAELQRLYAGEDLPEWHVFVGKTHARQLRHAFYAVGKGDGSGLLGGIVQASFVIGAAVVVCLRIFAPDAEPSLHAGFKDFYVHRVDYLTEVSTSDGSMPHLVLKPAIPNNLFSGMFLFFTNDPRSPVAHVMAQTWRNLLEQSQAHGAE